MIKEKVEKWVVKRSISIAIKFTLGVVIVTALFLYLLFKSNAGDDNYVKMYNEMGEIQNSSELNRNLKKQVEFVSKSTLNNTDTSGKMIPNKASSASVDTSGYTTYTSSSNSAEINQIIGIAESKLGSPYVYGALRVTDGGPSLFTSEQASQSKYNTKYNANSWVGMEAFDCSSFTQYLYSNIGISIGGDTGSQLNNGTPITKENLKPGDLVFTKPDHVTLYIGDGKVIHAPQSGDQVKVSPLWSFYAARRIIN